MLPYGRQTIESDDWQAVYRALQSPWLTTGPLVDEFERQFARAVDSPEAVAVHSGTAALHAALQAAGVGPGDEVILPAITFVATANAAVYLGATPVFADVDPETLLIDVADVARKITPRTRAVIGVDYAGQPCDYQALRQLTEPHQLVLIADACHSLGGTYQGRPVGSLADLNCFSFHPVKPMTTGEGGMITTSHPEWAAAMRRFRNHGIDSTHRSRQAAITHHYDMSALGFNYRMTELQAALGLSQLRKVQRFTRRRAWLADRYGERWQDVPHVRPLANAPDRRHAYHLYVVRWSAAKSGLERDEAFRRLHALGFGVNVHYRPVYWHSFYQREFGLRPGLCRRAEQAYREILTLPIFPAMTAADVQRVVAALGDIADLRAAAA